ncbi:flavin reductase family protein [Methanospirillum purgamenti]|nr:flavin reductase family protein [Methanospirillum hungatei]
MIFIEFLVDAMNKEQIGNNFFIPMPVVLVGTQVSGNANFMTVGWVARANANPPMIVCGIGNHHYTPKGIEENGTFSVNIPSTDLIVKTDYCGIVSGSKTDKSKVFDIFYGNLKTAPLIKECPVSIECKLVQIIPLPTNSLYLGEIVGVWVDGEIMADGKPDINSIDPIFLSMPDNRYWNLGEHIGYAWSDGKDLQLNE